MKTPRFAVLGAGVLAAAVLALTGCTSSGSVPPPSDLTGSSSAAIADPKAALVKAATALASTGYNVTTTALAGKVTGTGSVDPGKGITLDEKGTIQGVTIDLGVVVVGTDFYAKFDAGSLTSALGLDPKQWYKVDTTKLGSDSLPVDPTSGDAFGVAGLLTSVTDLKSTDAHTITGTVDLTAAKGVAMSQSDISSIGDKAKAVPFTVTLDDQGRFSEVKVDGTGISESADVEIKFDSYGSPTAATAPAGAIPAPDGIYKAFSGGA